MTSPEPRRAWIERAIAPVASRGISAIAAFNRWRLPPRDTPHPMLTGINRPMAEELTLTELVVDGDIPPELDGRYVRIGPNPVEPDPDRGRAGAVVSQPLDPLGIGREGARDRGRARPQAHL
jgi:hypothetical protein